VNVFGEFFKGEVGIGRLCAGIVIDQVSVGSFLGFLSKPDD